MIKVMSWPHENTCDIASVPSNEQLETIAARSALDGRLLRTSGDYPLSCIEFALVTNSSCGGYGRVCVKFFLIIPHTNDRVMGRIFALVGFRRRQRRQLT